jgi:hypothetical protein
MKRLTWLLLVLTLVSCAPAGNVVPTSISATPSHVLEAIPSTAISELGMDSGLFEQEGCRPPCWNGLMPGQSTSEDVDDFLDNLVQNQWPERHIRISDSPCKSIQISDNSNTGSVDLYVVKGNLTFIRSFSLYPNKPRLGEIVNYFGDPEYFKAVLYIGFDYSDYILEVYYPQKGVAFKILPDQKKDIDVVESDVFEILPDQKKISGRIGANVFVSEIHYFEPGDLSSYFLSQYSCDWEKTDAILRGQSEIDNFIQKWTGFGKIDVIIDSELQR